VTGVQTCALPISQIEKAIVSSRYFVICISEAALKKTGDSSPGFQDKELQQAYEIARVQIETDFVIIPARLEDCGHGDHRLSMQHQYDLFPDFEAGLDKLAVEMGGISLADKTATDTRSEEEKAVQVLLGKAMASLYAKDYEKSLTLSASATCLHPASAIVWFVYGLTLHELGRYEEALEAFDKAIELKPDDVYFWAAKGNIVYELGRYEEALEAYDKTIELKPDEADIWAVGKAIVFVQLGRYEEALEACNKAIELKPDDANTWAIKGGNLVNLKRLEEAHASYDKAIELNPDNGKRWYIKGKILGELGRDKEACEAFSKAKALGIKWE
jgi:tetratricopeptide (TPR) repeat protein